MAEKQKQKKQLVVSDREIDIIKATFSENDSLLKAMRAIFFGLEVTGEERESLKSTFSNPELVQIMYKRFLPAINKDTPIGQITDVWMGVESQIFGVPKETIYQAVMQKSIAVQMVERGLRTLQNPEAEVINISYDPNSIITDELGVKLLARNHYLRHVETQLSFLSVIAGQVDETTEQAKKRMQVDSSE